MYGSVWALGYALTGLAGGWGRFAAWLVTSKVLSLPGVVAAILICRRKSDDTETRCRRCGYILRGITAPRCPECGGKI